MDKETQNINYNNDRANQLNQINKLVVEKPTVEKQKINKPKQKETTEEQPQEIRRSTRTRKENKNDDYVY